MSRSRFRTRRRRARRGRAGSAGMRSRPRRGPRRARSGVSELFQPDRRARAAAGGVHHQVAPERRHAGLPGPRQRAGRPGFRLASTTNTPIGSLGTSSSRIQSSTRPLTCSSRQRTVHTCWSRRLPRRASSAASEVERRRVSAGTPATCPEASGPYLRSHACSGTPLLLWHLTLLTTAEVREIQVFRWQRKNPHYMYYTISRPGCAGP